jgi:hypothetical protein
MVQGAPDPAHRLHHARREAGCRGATAVYSADPRSI